MKGGNKTHVILQVRSQLAVNEHIFFSVENMTEIAWISNLPLGVKIPPNSSSITKCL